MKVCEKCGEEIGTKDGDNHCGKCHKKDRAKRRKEREDVLRSCGLVKVRGAMGGTYWE